MKQNSNTFHIPEYSHTIMNFKDTFSIRIQKNLILYAENTFFKTIAYLDRFK